MTNTPETFTDERAAIVAWLRSRGAFWNRLALRSEGRGPGYAATAHSQALLAASYTDHADAIESGAHLKQGDKS